MRIPALLCVFILAAHAGEPIPNPLIDYPGFQRIVLASAAEREQHRLTEAQFAAAMHEPGVVVLDARSADKFARCHLEGAVSLPFTDFTAETLARVLPGADTKVLIYCNNNFADRPLEFASKSATASLNLSTYTALRSYGYRNVYELGPLLRVSTSTLPFAGTNVLTIQAAGAR